MCSYNRRPTTLKGLERLHHATLPPGWSLRVHLVDDGSTDGTADAVSAAYPETLVSLGSGEMYWGGAMRLAHDGARAYDGLLWLNDDTEVDSECLLQIARELSFRNDTEPLALVGSTANKRGEVSYGGYTRTGTLVPRLTRLAPSGHLQPCDTFNGNFVFFTRRAVELLGPIDAAFPHAMGDLDYGFRARQLGIPVLLLPHLIGKCERNAARRYPASLLQTWKRISSPKELPIAAWWTYNRRYGGPIWPVTFAWPYVKVLLGTLFRTQERPHEG